MAQYLKKKTFVKVMRGYSPEEVDAYIEYLLKKYNELSGENEENRKRLGAALLKIRTLSEKTPEEISAKEIPSVESETESRRIVEQAKAEGQAILDNAKKQAEEIVRQAEDEAKKKAVTITALARKSAEEAEACARSQNEAAEKLYKEVFAFRDKVFNMYNDHIEMLESIAEEANTYFDTIAEIGGMGSGISINIQETESHSERQDTAAAEPIENEGDELFNVSETVKTEDFSEKTGSEEVPALEKPEVFPSDEETEFNYGGYSYPVTDEDETGDLFADDFLETLAGSSESEEGDNIADLSKYLGVLHDDDEAEEEETELPQDWAWRIAESVRTEEEEAKKAHYDEDIDFRDFDEFLEKGGRGSGDYSLTDEFDIVYSNRNTSRNMEEIVKQPLVSPEAPKNPKKHRRF